MASASATAPAGFSARSKLLEIARGRLAIANCHVAQDDDAMRTLPHTHSCFVCGESNVVGLNLRFETDGKVVHGRFTPRAEHVGFRDVVHGGIISTLLDEIMVWACVVQTK